MAKAAKPVTIKQVKRFTRDDVTTAIVLVEEINAAPVSALMVKAKAEAVPPSAVVLPPPRVLHTRDLDAAAALAACARVVHNVAENQCNGYRWEGAEEADEKRRARAVKRAEAILAERYPGVTLSTGGDPRGACFYLHLPTTRRHNTWGGEETGWAVT